MVEIAWSKRSEKSIIACRYVYIVPCSSRETLTPHLSKVNSSYISRKCEVKCWEKGVGRDKSTMKSGQHNLKERRIVTVILSEFQKVT